MGLIPFKSSQCFHKAGIILKIAQGSYPVRFAVIAEKMQSVIRHVIKKSREKIM